jgi:arylsulfatase A-like enzyme
MAKKKHARHRKRKHEKQKHQPQSRPSGVPARYNKIIQRLREAGWENQEFVYDPQPAEKMSEVLRDFIEPYIEFADNAEAMRRLITVALVAWNTALLPKAEQAESLKQVSEALPADVVDDFYAIVAEMIERKNTLFAEYTRTILDYELTDTGDSYRISVISTLPQAHDESTP